ncbi:hypothetical protein [Kaistia sp. MMO-174]|nr:hypothetical protein [Hyphomicrobiales bacterium]
MNSVPARAPLAISCVALLSLAATAPAFGYCGHGRTVHARMPPCGNQQIWDTQFQRCLSYSAHGPPDQQAWPRGPSWASNYNYGRAMTDWNQ